MKRSNQLSVIAALSSLWLCAASESAADLDLPHDGWVSWQVPAVIDAPAWCCFEGQWKSTATAPATCRLDGSPNGYGNRDDATTDTMRIYARFAAGRLERVRALAPDCPVQTNGSVRNLGEVSDDVSGRWLANQLEQIHSTAGKRLRNDMTAALAVHRSQSAQAALVDIARRNPALEQRKEAVFWLAHVRGQDGAKAATSIMFADDNPRMREHAAFAVSQSKSPHIASDLIRLGNTDPDGRVRGQAWFWLGQQAFPQTEAAIAEMLRREQDHHVREQGVFALSRLPDERGTKALIAVAENASLSREDRKRAIFWLAQEGSDSALTYLDRVVTPRR